MNPLPSERLERRRRERIIADLPVRLTIIEESEGTPGLKFYGGRIVNLSEEGVALETYFTSSCAMLKNGQTVSAEITLPDSKDAITITGQATWATTIHNPFDQSTISRVGLKISGISPPDAERLKAYISKAIAGSQ